MKNRAFTLIELLVVIAIIAILAAILFPVFAQAKASAKKIASVSNVKQLTTATLMYTADNDDGFPQGSGACWWQSIDGGWTYSIIPYMKNWGILVSPGDPKDRSPWPDWMRTMAEAVNISYAANGYMKWDGTGWGMYGVMGMDQAHPQSRPDGSCNAGAWMSKGVTNGSEINQVATTVMFAERFSSYQLFGPSNFFTGINWWDWVGTGGLIPDSRRDGTAYTVNGVVFTKNNRSGGVNADWAGKACFTWVDGHASVISPTASNAKPDDNSTNFWDIQH
jgi:prepilin-type N-terminal cleavage/methylation domain-containing protein